MEQLKLEKFKSHFLKHKVMILVLLCLGFVGVSLYVLKDSYANRVDNDFSELQTFLLEVREKDKEIYNHLKLKEIEKRVDGIDVSSWQNEIDWDLVKETNVEFAMIRVGYRGMETGLLNEDSQFRYNISEANRVGIPVGVYFFSTATNAIEAVEEATFVLNLIKDYDVHYPVVYDFELYDQKRATGVSWETINENAIIFMDYLEAHGYRSMYYSNITYLKKVWDTEQLKDYKFWLAQYGDDEPVREYDMLQYTDKGNVKGIGTTVDLNVANFAYEVEE